MLRICERVSSDLTPSDAVTLTSEQRRKSRLRARLDSGRVVALLLPRGMVLHDGDLLGTVDGRVVRVTAAREGVSTASTCDPLLLARACYHLGNRHVALQIDAHRVRYLRDHVLDRLVKELGLDVSHEQAPFEPETGAFQSHHHHSTPYQNGGDTLQSDAVSGRLEMPPESLTPFLNSLRLASPALPIGAYAYSQGLECAITRRWVSNEAQAAAWILGLAGHIHKRLEIPVFARLYRAWQSSDEAAAQAWSRRLQATREAAELRAGDRHLGVALARLLADMDVTEAEPWVRHRHTTAAAMFALAATCWGIGLREAAAAYLWSWCENQVAVAVKIIPLGQTAGQRILERAVNVICGAVEEGLALEDEAIGCAAQGLGIAGALHETQYSRLFRS